MPDTPIAYNPWRFVNKTETCWLWMGALDAYGYGALRAFGKVVKAHRFFYALQGPGTPQDLDHLCRVRNCVWREHLEPITRGDNVRRSPLVGRSPNSRRDRDPISGRFVPNAI